MNVNGSASWMEEKGKNAFLMEWGQTSERNGRTNHYLSSPSCALSPSFIAQFCSNTIKLRSKNSYAIVRFEISVKVVCLQNKFDHVVPKVSFLISIKTARASVIRLTQYFYRCVLLEISVFSSHSNLVRAILRTGFLFEIHSLMGSTIKVCLDFLWQIFKKLTVFLYKIAIRVQSDDLTT